MDADKIKNSLLLHFEKMILGVIVAVSGFLIYQGTNLPNFLKEKQPDQLVQEANSVKLAIDEDHTENIIAERDDVDLDIVARTKDLYKPVDATTYKLSKIWVGETGSDSVIRRQDPLLLPILDVRTVGVISTLALNGARTVDGYDLSALEPADPVEKEEKPRPRRRTRPQRGMGGMDMEMSGGGYGQEMMMDMMGGGMSGGMGGPQTTEAGNPIRKFSSKLSLGVTASSGASKTNFPQPKLGWFIAGTALLPHREIYEAYELALKDAGGYDPARDTPLYYDFEVQRADVTDKSVDQLTEDDWVKAYDRVEYTQIADKLWDGFAPEIIPADYRDENITTWIPPVMLDDYGYFAMHPKIPMMSQIEMKRAAEAASLAKENEDNFDLNTFKIEDEDSVLNDPGSSMRGGSSGGYGGEDMMMDGGGYGDEMMMGGGMASFSRGRIEADPVEHKLIRFYDFGLYPARIAPGRKYSYRLRYAVIDPNYPASPSSQPGISKLAPEVAARVSAKNAETRQTKKRNFRLWSEWSEPTMPDSLPPLQQSFAGSVNPGTVNIYKVGNREIPVARDVPKAELLLSQFDKDLGVRVPVILKDVNEGTVLRQTVETADVIDPIELKIKKVTDYAILSSTMVIDIEGGVPLQISEGLTSPGQILLFDGNGKLKVSEDVSEQRDYRVYSYADEREAE